MLANPWHRRGPSLGSPLPTLIVEEHSPLPLPLSLVLQVSKSGQSLAGPLSNPNSILLPGDSLLQSHLPEDCHGPFQMGTNALFGSLASW